MKTVITARSALFPGSENVEAYWQRILAAEPATLSSFEKHWNLKKSEYLNEEGATDKTYLDQAYGLPVEFAASADAYSFGDEGRQIELGKKILDDLLKDKTIDRSRTALVLGTSWSDAHYLAADARIVEFGQSLEEALRGKTYDPSGQVEELANHIGAEGPRSAIDTACASSLYALAAAERLLLSGLADHVIVLGLNAYLPSFLFIGFSKIQAMSRTGSILPFSKDANGIVLGEGVGAILVESANTAKKNGRRPLAVVRAIGLSSDGKEGSVFTPGRAGQKLAYERAYADLDRREVDYIEAHGTGTPLGDATEMECLGEFFRASGVKGLALGSVKSLIGHSLAAAGVASLIKGLEMLRTRTLPPHIPVEPSEHLQDSPLYLLNEPKNVKPSGRPMRVGINSLGFGGANAHIVLEEWLDTTPEDNSQVLRTKRVAIVAAEFAVGKSETFPKRADHHPETYPKGRYFSGPFPLSLSHLGLGPAQAQRLDPFLAVFAHQCATVYEQLEQKSSDKTAVMACANFGSEMALRFTRRLQAKFKKSESRSEPTMSVEAITSSLPALTSGFPAAAINLRGMHMTVSGAQDSFWSTLLPIPSWFDTGLEAIVFGASSFIKSPYDFSSHKGSTPVESSSAFAIVPERLAGDKALIWIEYSDEMPSKEVELGRSSAFDYGEVSGVEILHELLKSGPKMETLAFTRNGHSLAKLRLTRTDRAWSSSEGPKADDEVVVNLGMTHDPLPANPKNLAQWNKDLSELIIFLIESRARVQAALGVNSRALVIHKETEIRRQTKNVVITEPSLEAKEYRSVLIVDETHPYFYDHPLDHVPGILIFEAAVQLSERYLKINPEIARGRFIAAAAISFKRYTENNIPTDLKLSISGDQVLIQGTQSNKITVLITLTLKQPEAHFLEQGAYPTSFEIPDKTILHKHKPENMLVARIEKVGEERYHALAVPLQAGHFFQDGDVKYHTLVYLLEVARQSMMQLAHLVMGIPLGTPMNLVDLKLSLDSPIPRDHVLILESRKSRVFEADDNMIARIITSFKIGDQRLGQVEITAQVMKKEYYLKQRGKTPKDEGKA